MTHHLIVYMPDGSIVTDGPFATMEAARAAKRQWEEGGRGEVDEEDEEYVEDCPEYDDITRVRIVSEGEDEDEER